MLNTELVRELLHLKLEKGYTLHDLSRILDIQVTTIERWIKTGRINRIYAKLVKEKLGI